MIPLSLIWGLFSVCAKQPANQQEKKYILAGRDTGDGAHIKDLF